MAKTKAKAKKSTEPYKSKFLYGAALGALIGTLAIIAIPRIAVYILVGLIIIAAYVFILTRQGQSQSRSAKGKAKTWSPRAASPAPVLGALIVGVMAVAGVQYLGLSFAWHPEGTIKKTVQNVTAGGAAVDANTAATALTVKPGDILNYTVVVGNVAANASNHDNDMAYTVLTDTLPTGVQLVSDTSKRTITESLGTILPGKSITKTYQVKVTSTTDGSVLENKACYTANSVPKDNPQSGCDVAIIKIQLPPPPPPTPAYSCNLLTVTVADNRKITAKVDYSATNGATFKSITYDFGNSSQPLVSDKTTVNYTYDKDGTYNVTAKLTVTVDGADKTAAGAACTKSVTITTPPTDTPPTDTPPTDTPPTTTPPDTTPPTTTPPADTPTLPNTGARSIIVIVLFAAVAGYLVSALYGYSKSGKSIRFR